MAQQNQYRKYLTPQPDITAAGTPERLFATESELLVPSFLVEAPIANTGDMYLSDTLANMAAGNYSVIEPGNSMTIINEPWGALRALFDLYYFYFDGATSGDKLVVSYTIATGEIY